MYALFVHAVGTSGLHAPERRRLAHASRCRQCGAVLGADAGGPPVAAHVVRYDSPCLCPCRGELTLVTTCRACNEAHRAGGGGKPAAPPGPLPRLLLAPVGRASGACGAAGSEAAHRRPPTPGRRTGRAAAAPGLRWPRRENLTLFCEAHPAAGGAPPASGGGTRGGGGPSKRGGKDGMPARTRHGELAQTVMFALEALLGAADGAQDLLAFLTMARRVRPQLLLAQPHAPELLTQLLERQDGLGRWALAVMDAVHDPAVLAQLCEHGAVPRLLARFDHCAPDPDTAARVVLRLASEWAAPPGAPADGPRLLPAQEARHVRLRVIGFFVQRLACAVDPFSTQTAQGILAPFVVTGCDDLLALLMEHDVSLDRAPDLPLMRGWLEARVKAIADDDPQGLETARGYAEYLGMAPTANLLHARHNEAVAAVMRRERLSALGLDEWLTPDEFLCPVTRERFVLPMLASDGHTYESSALVRIFEGDCASPLTREPLVPHVTILNTTLRRRMRRHEEDLEAIAPRSCRRWVRGWPTRRARHPTLPQA